MSISWYREHWTIQLEVHLNPDSIKSSNTLAWWRQLLIYMSLRKSSFWLLIMHIAAIIWVYVMVCRLIGTTSLHKPILTYVSPSKDNKNPDVFKQTHSGNVICNPKGNGLREFLPLYNINHFDVLYYYFIIMLLFIAHCYEQLCQKWQMETVESIIHSIYSSHIHTVPVF